jgi:hypothetical protein
LALYLIRSELQFLSCYTKPPPRKQAWQNQQRKKTMFCLTLVRPCESVGADSNVTPGKCLSILKQDHSTSIAIAPLGGRGDHGNDYWLPLWAPPSMCGTLSLPLFLFAFLPFSLLPILYDLLHGHTRIAPPPSELAMSQPTVAEEATPSLD